MRALVTGATGFLGSHIAGALARAGHQVRILRRAHSNLLALNEQLGDHEAETVIGDLLDDDALRHACADIDWVFHSAAMADYWRANRQRLIQVNIDGTRRLLAAAAAAGVGRVIFTSSAACIGPRADGRPAREDEPFRLERASFPYAWSKAQAEAICAEYHERGLPVVTVNPAVIVGPGDLNMLAGSMLRLVKKWGALLPVSGGGATLIDVRDVARLQLRAAECGQPGERYLLGAENLEFAEWLALAADAVGAARPRWRLPSPLLGASVSALAALQALGLPIRANLENARLLQHYSYFDCRKATDAFGPPQYSIRQSLRDSYLWYERAGMTADW